MKNEVLFSEKQYFRQWWLILLLAFVCTVIGFATYQIIISQKTLLPMFFAWSILVTIAFTFYFMHLKTNISAEGIHIHFFPFLKKEISWKEIDKMYVREYKPIGEFGGWGIRFGFTGGKAYTIAGNKGIQLELNDGSKILIGTQKEGELEIVLRQLRKQDQKSS